MVDEELNLLGVYGFNAVGKAAQQGTERWEVLAGLDPSDPEWIVFGMGSREITLNYTTAGIPMTRTIDCPILLASGTCGSGSPSILSGFANVFEWSQDGPVLRQAVYYPPEPATMAMMTLGGLALLRRRRR